MRFRQTRLGTPKRDWGLIRPRLAPAEEVDARLTSGARRRTDPRQQETVNRNGPWRGLESLWGVA